jgi:hypothetical protein
VQIGPLAADGATSALSTTTDSVALVPASTDSAISLPSAPRKKPPRVRKPSRNHDQCVAPTADLEAHRGALRQAFGNTLSDEFAEVILGKLITALRPGPFDHLDEATLNAAIALIASINPQVFSEQWQRLVKVTATFPQRVATSYPRRPPRERAGPGMRPWSISTSWVNLPKLICIS